MNIYSETIKAESDVELIQAVWTEIDPDWRNNPMPNGDAVYQNVVVKDGCGSPYRFANQMRELLGDEFAQVWGVNHKGYFAAAEFDPDGTIIVFAKN